MEVPVRYCTGEETHSELSELMITLAMPRTLWTYNECDMLCCDSVVD